MGATPITPTLLVATVIAGAFFNWLGEALPGDPSHPGWRDVNWVLAAAVIALVWAVIVLARYSKDLASKKQADTEEEGKKAAAAAAAQQKLLDTLDRLYGSLKDSVATNRAVVKIVSWCQRKTMLVRQLKREGHISAEKALELLEDAECEACLKAEREL